MSGTPTPLISVVTPFYNTALYLEECIRSVLAQTHRSFEYVLYNNCSTDGSREIAARYAAADPRIRLIDAPDFVGQVENYNRAIGEISPQANYFKIVQADDAIDPECLEKMVEVAERDPSVAVVGSLYLNGSRVCGTGLPWQVWFSTGRDLCRRQLLQRQFFFGSPTVLMFRTDLLATRRPFYKEGRYHEDTEAGYEILKTRNFGFVHAVLSYLRNDNESIMKSRATFDPIELDRFIIFERFAGEFLTVDERRSVAATFHEEYWQCLGRAVLHFRSSAYWRYHRNGLATVGRKILWRKVAFYVMAEVADLLLNPLKTLQRCARFVRRSLSTPQAIVSAARPSTRS